VTMRNLRSTAAVPHEVAITGQCPLGTRTIAFPASPNGYATKACPVTVKVSAAATTGRIPARLRPFVTSSCTMRLEASPLSCLGQQSAVLHQIVQRGIPAA